MSPKSDRQGKEGQAASPVMVKAARVNVAAVPPEGGVWLYDMSLEGLPRRDHVQLPLSVPQPNGCVPARTALESLGISVLNPQLQNQRPALHLQRTFFKPIPNVFPPP